MQNNNHPEKKNGDFFDSAEQLNFVNLWFRIAPHLTDAGLDDRTQKRLRTSVNQLPNILMPLLDQPANPENVAKARILFFNYALKSGISRLLAKSSELRSEHNLSRLKLKSDFNLWFVKQIQILEETSIVVLPDYVHQKLQEENITIGQLLAVNPILFYRLPIMV
jgi:hypothetical protein